MSVINSTSTKISANKTELKKVLAKMLTNLITNKKWSDKDAALELDVNRSRIFDLSKGNIKDITMVDLLDLLVKFGYKSDLKMTSNKDMADITITKVPVEKSPIIY